jgi:CRP-like cAMP-binding protein
MLRNWLNMDLYKIEDIKNAFSIKCCYPKGAVIYYENDLCDRIGYVISGRLELLHFTIDGEERTLATLNKNSIFGDFLINSTNPYYPGHLTCLTDSKIAFLDKTGLNILIKENAGFRNFYLSQLSEKALKLNFHNKILLQASLRDKILMFLSQETLEHNTKSIKIISKQALANYFNVARPSLSRELSNMKKLGLIDYDRYYIHVKVII